MFYVLPLCGLLEPWITPLNPLDCFEIFLCFLYSCSVCPCQTIACLCSSCAPTALGEHPSRGLDDLFPLPDERELTTSASMGSECPRPPVSFGLESRILKPKLRFHVLHNLQTRVLESWQAIQVECHMLLKLFRHQCFQTSKLDVFSNLSFNFFSLRDT